MPKEAKWSTSSKTKAKSLWKGHKSILGGQLNLGHEGILLDAHEITAWDTWNEDKSCIHWAKCAQEQKPVSFVLRGTKNK